MIGFYPTEVPRELVAAFKILTKLTPIELSARVPFLFVKNLSNNLLFTDQASQLRTFPQLAQFGVVRSISVTTRNDWPGLCKGSIGVSIPRENLFKKVHGINLLVFFLTPGQEFKIQFGWNSMYSTKNSGLGYYGKGNTVEYLVMITNFSVVLTEAGLYDIDIEFTGPFEEVNQYFSLSELEFNSTTIKDKTYLTTEEKELGPEKYNGVPLRSFLDYLNGLFARDMDYSYLGNTRFEVIESPLKAGMHHGSGQTVGDLLFDLRELISMRASEEKVSFRSFVNKLLKSVSTKELVGLDWDLTSGEKDGKFYQIVRIFDSNYMIDREAKKSSLLTIDYGTKNSLLKGTPGFSGEDKGWRDIMMSGHGQAGYAEHIIRYIIEISKGKTTTHKRLCRDIIFQQLNKIIGKALQKPEAEASGAGVSKIFQATYSDEEIQQAATVLIDPDNEEGKKFIDGITKLDIIPKELLFLGYTGTFRIFGFTGLLPYQCFNLKGTGLFDGMYMITDVTHTIDIGSFSTEFTAVLASIEPGDPTVRNEQLASK